MWQTDSSCFGQDYFDQLGIKNHPNLVIGSPQPMHRWRPGVTAGRRDSFQSTLSRRASRADARSPPSPPVHRRAGLHFLSPSEPATSPHFRAAQSYSSSCSPPPPPPILAARRRLLSARRSAPPAYAPSASDPLSGRPSPPPSTPRRKPFAASAGLYAAAAGGSAARAATAPGGHIRVYDSGPQRAGWSLQSTASACGGGTQHIGHGPGPHPPRPALPAFGRAARPAAGARSAQDPANAEGCLPRDCVHRALCSDGPAGDGGGSGRAVVKLAVVPSSILGEARSGGAGKHAHVGAASGEAAATRDSGAACCRGAAWARGRAGRRVGAAEARTIPGAGTEAEEEGLRHRGTRSGAGWKPACADAEADVWLLLLPSRAVSPPAAAAAAVLAARPSPRQAGRRRGGDLGP